MRDPDGGRDGRESAGRVLAVVACVALYVAADVALRTTALPASRTLPWHPGAGLAFVALLVAGPVAAAPLFVARLLLAAWPGAPMAGWPGLAGVASAAGVVGGYALTATAVRRRIALRAGAWRVRDALWLSGAVVVAALVAALASVMTRPASAGPEQLWRDALTFAAGDAAGAMVVVPLALFVLLPGRRRVDASAIATGSPDDAATAARGPGRLERAGQVAAVAAAIALGIVSHARGGDVLGYLCFVPLAWVALRDGVRGAAIVIAAYGTACGVASVWLGIGPRQSLEAQLVLLTLGVSGLLLGATRTAVVESESRYWQLLATAHEGIWRLDRTGHTRYVNARVAELLGRDAAEIVGRPVTDFVHPDARMDARAAGEVARDDAAAGPYELTLATRDGEPRPVLVRASPVRSATSGEVIGTVATLTDLTGWRDAERRRAEAERARARAQSALEAAFRASPDALLLFRGDDDTIVDANDVWRTLLGVEGAALVGQRLAALSLWADTRAHDRLVRQAAERGTVHDAAVEIRRRGRDGVPEFGHALVSIVPAPTDGTTYYLLVCHDVTEERRAEEQRGTLQRLEELGRLASAVAHDFNNLLTVVHSYAELIARSVRDGQPVTLEDVLEIDRAAARGKALTERLLAFGGSRRIEPRHVDLSAAVRAAAGMLRPLVGSRVSLAYALADGLPPIAVDPVQLDQVLLNLVVNAVDAMPHGGRLTIATRLVAPDGIVALDVSDTGHGMDEATRARIFEPFYTTKASASGTGLGLSVVAGIVSQARGRVHVRSAPGAGTTFTVTWPPVDAAARTCVMVVEDEDVVRHTIVRLLAQAGFDTLEARDGREALDRLTADGASEAQPALVLADLVMPRMGGRALAGALATARPGLPVVLMTAFADGWSGVAWPPNVAGPLLAKPFGRDALVARVRRALAGRTSACA